MTWGIRQADCLFCCFVFFLIFSWTIKPKKFDHYLLNHAFKE